MDLRTVVIISTLLLMIADSDQIPTESHPNATTPIPQNSNTPEGCSCPTAVPAATAAPISSALIVSLLTVRWMKACEGKVILSLHSSSSSYSPVCHNNQKIIQDLLSNVCLNKKGCEGTPKWSGGNTQKSFYINKEGVLEERENCKELLVGCKVEAPCTYGELQAYKVVTALLCLVLLVLFLIRFTRPTVKALQKRLSDRRQNRWIGPTQSHSVSYHRSKTAVKSNDGEKRLSYPALERLAVRESTEPSSNRNSDYNL